MLHAAFLVIIPLIAVWFGCYINKLETIPTSIFGFAMAYFAYLAYINFKEGVRLELFEKRLKIYNALHELFSSVIFTQKAMLDFSDLNDYLIKANDCTRGIGHRTQFFLFGSDVRVFLKDCDALMIRLMRVGEELKDIPKEKYKDKVKELHDTFQKLYKEFENIESKFEPYLYFGDYRKMFYQ